VGGVTIVEPDADGTEAGDESGAIELEGGDGEENFRRLLGVIGRETPAFFGDCESLEGAALLGEVFSARDSTLMRKSPVGLISRQRP
jgi:hypothetical protein